MTKAGESKENMQLRLHSFFFQGSDSSLKQKKKSDYNSPALAMTDMS